jgi:hypothetical protein
MDTNQSQEHPSTTMTPPLPKRRWFQFSLRTLFLLITAVAGLLSWQMYRAEREATAKEQLMHFSVLILNKPKAPAWFWDLCAKRFRCTAIHAHVFSLERAEDAIPYLKMLPNLTELELSDELPLYSGRQLEQYLQRRKDVEAMLRRELPHVRLTRPPMRNPLIARHQHAEIGTEPPSESRPEEDGKKTRMNVNGHG